MLHYRIKIALTIHNVFAKNLHHFGLVTIIACGQHVAIRILLATSRTDVEIISGIARLLSSFGNKSSEMAFVRTFVGRKTHIPINAIGTILGGKSGHIGIEHRNFLDNLVYQLMEACLVLQELFLMSIEPFAVIVALQLTEKVYDCFHNVHFT